MHQDKTYSNIKYYFQRQSNLSKFNEVATVLQSNGIYNWDQELQSKCEQDLMDMGLEEKYAQVIVSESRKHSQQGNNNNNNMRSSTGQRENTEFYGSYLTENKNKNNYNLNNDASDFSDIVSMMSNSTVHANKRIQRDLSKQNMNYYTDEIIERETPKIYQVWEEVNQEFFNQFPDLTRIIFLNFVAQEKMLIYGGTLASNVEDVFRAFTKFVDYRKINHSITPNTTPEEVFERSPTQSSSSKESQIQEANFYLLHQIFQSSSPLINSIIRHLQGNDQLTAYATTEQNEPNKTQFDSQILEEFLFTYFEEDKRVDQKKDNFDEFVEAMWTKNNVTGKILKPQSFLKTSQDPSKFDAINSKVPNCFKKQEIKLSGEFLMALGELAFSKVEDSTGILKIYLKEFRERLLDNKILISQRRWVRIFRVLKIVAFTRGIGDTTRVSLADCFLTPFLMSKNRAEFELTSAINQEVIQSLARFYGSLKLSHYLERHFWLLSSDKTFIRQIKKIQSHLPSFFQGCISHSDYFKILPENLQQQKYSQLCYSVSGPDRKILSDDFYGIDVNKAYEMKLDIKTTHKMIAYIGLVCFDENKEFIHSTQVCRVDNSQVLLLGDDPNEKILIVSEEYEKNLKKWNYFDSGAKDNSKNFAYLRSLGFYTEGDITQFIPSSSVIQDTQKPYNTTENHGAYSYIGENKIKLTEIGWKKYISLKDKGGIEFNKTMIMNHFEGGTYTFAECFDDYIKKWTQKNYWWKGETRAAENNKFRKGTKFVKIVLLSNYNSGFPEFKITQKDASILWKNIEFNYLK